MIWFSSYFFLAVSFLFSTAPGGGVAASFASTSASSVFFAEIWFVI